MWAFTDKFFKEEQEEGSEAVDRDLLRAKSHGGAGGKGLEAVESDLFKAQNLKELQEERVLRKSIGSCSPLKGLEINIVVQNLYMGLHVGIPGQNLKEEQEERLLRQSIGSCCPLKRSGNKYHHHRHMPGRTLAHMPGRTLAKHNQENSSSGFSRCRICIWVYMWAFTDKISEPTQCLCSPSQPARSPASF